MLDKITTHILYVRIVNVTINIKINCVKFKIE